MNKVIDQIVLWNDYRGGLEILATITKCDDGFTLNLWPTYEIEFNDDDDDDDEYEYAEQEFYYANQLTNNSMGDIEFKTVEELYRFIHEKLNHFDISSEARHVKLLLSA